MKIWKSYGSEHSAKLVMIGRFKDAASAEEAKAIIDQFVEFISERDSGADEESNDSYPDDVMEFLRRVNTYIISPLELEQFRYDVRVELKGTEIHASTDEYDISGFLKLLVDNGARVEVYSAHDYPKTSGSNPDSESKK
jgi:hypothetical protein